MVHLTPTFVLFVLFLYFAMLVGMAWYTGRNNSNEGFFLANRKVHWYVVAYVMIGTSISGLLSSASRVRWEAQVSTWRSPTCRWFWAVWWVICL